MVDTGRVEAARAFAERSRLHSCIYRRPPDRRWGSVSETKIEQEYARFFTPATGKLKSGKNAVRQTRLEAERDALAGRMQAAEDVLRQFEIASTEIERLQTDASELCRNAKSWLRNALACVIALRHTRSCWPNRANACLSRKLRNREQKCFAIAWKISIAARSK